jgi:hypothetical protein
MGLLDAGGFRLRAGLFVCEYTSLSNSQRAQMACPFLPFLPCPFLPFLPCPFLPSSRKTGSSLNYKH